MTSSEHKLSGTRRERSRNKQKTSVNKKQKIFPHMSHIFSLFPCYKMVYFLVFAIYHFPSSLCPLYLFTFPFPPAYNLPCFFFFLFQKNFIASSLPFSLFLFFHPPNSPSFLKGNRPIADLRYGEEDSISPNTLICAAFKG